MGITGTVRRSEILIHGLTEGDNGDDDWLIPRLNKLYDNEVKERRIITYSNYGIKCDYALIDSKNIPEKNVKEAIGFGICFPKAGEYEYSRIIIFEDLIDSEFLDIAVAHEFAHVGSKDIGVDESQKEALTLELEIAELTGKKQEWIDYNIREDPSRIKEMQEFGLLK